MQGCAAQGWDQRDHSALVKILEHMAAHQVAAG
jgi:2-hydroxy-3-oxopropionate reductase